LVGVFLSPVAALRLLESPGCPACRAGATAEERWVFAFVTEHYGAPATLAELGRALGFCPSHSRPLLARVEAPWVMRTAYAAVVAAALERLNGARAAPPPAACPLCRSRRTSEHATIAFLTEALARRPVSEAYRAAGGFCLPHAVIALGRARAAEALVVADTLIEALGAADGEATLVERLAGRDPDRAARRALRARLGPPPPACDAAHARQSATAALRARLRVAACPTCLAVGRAEQRYLAWLAREQRRDPGALAAEGLWLCATHLHDLLEEDAAAAGWVAALARFRVQGELWRLRAVLSRPDGHTPLGRLRAAARALVPSRSRAVAAAVAPVVRERPCAACHAARTTEEREAALVVAALHDGPLARRYERAHGLCARHVLALADSSRTSLPARVLDARLRLLAWELEEAGRKSGWSARHEPAGAERTAWCRAAALLDGRVFLGAPATPAARS
jgi:hypothetical protein